MYITLPIFVHWVRAAFEYRPIYVEIQRTNVIRCNLSVLLTKFFQLELSKRLFLRLVRFLSFVSTRTNEFAAQYLLDNENLIPAAVHLPQIYKSAFAYSDTPATFRQSTRLKLFSKTRSLRIVELSLRLRFPRPDVAPFEAIKPGEPTFASLNSIRPKRFGDGKRAKPDQRPT